MLLLSLLQSPIVLITFIVALVIAITVHEFAHAWAANKMGDPTAKLMGRLTLNPFAHLDPMGTLFLFIVGFGWGKPVPTNPNNYKSPSSDIWVSLSGIMANIATAFVLAIPIRIWLLTGHTVDSSLWMTLLSLIVDLNLVLAVFNILPIYPLDGSHVVEHYLSHQNKIAFRQYGPMILLAVLIFDRVSSFSILSSIMEPAIRLLSFIVKGTFSIFL